MADSGERTLALGDTIKARPCVVAIDFVTSCYAYGHCSTCDDRHVIDLLAYEHGRGPWQRATWPEVPSDDR